VQAAPPRLTAPHRGLDPAVVLRASVLVAMVASVVAGAPRRASAASGEELEESGIVDPRKRNDTITHRFRLGLALEYIRLSAAVDSDTGEVQRFHYMPLGLDFAYQAQFLEFLMVRPSLTVGGNIYNTTEAMPLVIHPQLHAGYQGRLLGVAFGYGWFTPPVRHKDARSVPRDDIGQPLILNNHHVGGEISLTTRVDRGALSFQFRFAGVTSRTQHFELDDRRWRPMIMFNIGWYFGDGRKQAERKLERRRRRR
jgi:hypothetical protein